MKKVSYSAVVLDEESRTELIQLNSHVIPEEWEIISHHMTINMGAINPEFEKYLGDEIELTIVKIGKSDKAIAVQVEGFPTSNDIPHITLAVNREEGGKPFDSNKIVDWVDVETYSTFGIVEEISY